jgi:hypothetical protein
MRASGPHILAAMKLPKDPLWLIGRNPLHFSMSFLASFTKRRQRLRRMPPRPPQHAKRRLLLRWRHQMSCSQFASNVMLEFTISDEFYQSLLLHGYDFRLRRQLFHLVKMLAVFAGAQSSILSGSDPLTFTSPPAHCLRICSNISKQTASTHVSLARTLHSIPRRRWSILICSNKVPSCYYLFCVNCGSYTLISP